MIIEKHYCDWCSKELKGFEKEKSPLFRIDLCLECRREVNKVLGPVYKKCSSNVNNTTEEDGTL